MEVVRYRPGEAVRWLQTGAEVLRRTASKKSKLVAQSRARDAHSLGEDLKTAATAIVQFGRGTYTDLLHQRARAAEYVLQEDHFDVVVGASIKSVRYDRIKEILIKGDRAELTLDKGSLVIRPFAHVVAGRTKVPIGWSRNGVEVPYELLLDELSARAGVEPEEA